MFSGRGRSRSSGPGSRAESPPLPHQTASAVPLQTLQTLPPGRPSNNNTIDEVGLLDTTIPLPAGSHAATLTPSDPLPRPIGTLTPTSSRPPSPSYHLHVVNTPNTSSSPSSPPLQRDLSSSGLPADHDGGGAPLEAITPPVHAMPSTLPFLRSSSRQVENLSYGSVSSSPSLNPSSVTSEPFLEDAQAMRMISEPCRVGPSPFATDSFRAAPRRSEDLDATGLAIGSEGRFVAAEASLSSNVLDDSELGSKLGSIRGAGSSYLTDNDDDDDDDDDPDSPSSFADNSMYEAVRASVSPVDNTALSINTPRMWTLSVLFSLLGSSTNLFFSLRYPSVSITPVIALLLVHPLGHLWDFVFKRSSDPSQEFVNGTLHGPLCSPSTPRLRRWRLWLAKGRWNEKEHTCVYVSSNVAFGFAFATDVIVEQHKFYHQEVSISYQLLLTLSTQILGYAFAGLTRRFLVRPGGMIWPGTLMSAAMFSTLHKDENKPANGWTISRWRFFYIVWAIGFAFYFLPGLLMPALSYFNIVTWVAPKSVVAANLFGVVSGLGMLPITFDWAQVTYIGSPLLVPFWAAVNVIGGLAVVMWIVAPILYYSNILFSSYMPILSTSVFDNTGNVYDVSRILGSNFVFDREAYQNYSRVFLPITYVLSYGVQFAGLSALLSHTLCWYGSDIWKSWKRAFQEARDDGRTAYQPISNSVDNLPTPSHTAVPPLSRSSSGGDSAITREDIHARLMRRYDDAPLTWYLITFLSMTAIGIFVVEYYPVNLPWYGLLLALAISIVFFIPNGIIMAVTNQHSSIYLICQLVCGVVFPGRPVANMVFVTYGYISSAQGIKFAADLKLGHYMKIPPRILFSVQMVATLVSSVTQIGVLNWMFANIKGLCTTEAVNGFICPLAKVHFNGSILWGVVGPTEFFGPDAMYRPLVWFFLVGAVLPVPFWLYGRNRKDSIVRKINFPVIFGSMSWIPPATGLNFSVWAVVCYVFNYRIKRQAGAWWGKYTMTLSAALDSGLAFGIVVVFFGFIYSGVAKNFRWWGTEVYKQGCDWQACPYQAVPEGGRFGPDTW